MERLKTIALFIAATVIILLSVRNCNDKRNFDEERKTYALRDSLNQVELALVRDASGREIKKYAVRELSYKQMLTSQSKEMEQVKKDLKAVGVKLNKVLSITRVGLTTTDSILVPVHDTIQVCGTDDFKTQKNFNYEDKWLNLKGSADFTKIGDNLVFDNLKVNYQVNNELGVTYAYDRDWFLGKKYLSLTVTSENPNTTTGKVQTFVIKPEKRFYEKWWFHTAVGFAAGWYITEQIRK